MTALYGVGDVLYLVSNRQRQVLPVRVEEQLNRRTLEGESVTYRVRGPGAERTVELSSLSETGDIYRTLEEARTALHEKASRAIDQVLQEAQGLADQHFSPSGVTVELCDSWNAEPGCGFRWSRMNGQLSFTSSAAAPVSRAIFGMRFIARAARWCPTIRRVSGRT